MAFTVEINKIMKSYNQFLNENKMSDLNKKLRELKIKLRETKKTIEEVKKKKRHEDDSDKKELLTLSIEKYEAKLDMLDANIEITKIKRNQL